MEKTTNGDATTRNGSTTTIQATNPTGATIMFDKYINTTSQGKTQTYYGLRTYWFGSSIFPNKEQKTLFELAEKRYNTYFKDMSYQEWVLYKELLISNNNSNVR